MLGNKRYIGHFGLMKKHHTQGFTLIELLVVIAVLAILVTAVLPFGASMQDETKKQKTVQLLESIRFGLIGAEYAYDANGNRVIGGYVGDFGELPDLIVHKWDEGTKAWLIRDKDTDALPDVYDTSVANDYDKFNQNAMPLALWTNYIKVNGQTSYQEIVDKDDWQGPYVVQTRDDFTNDDDIFTYTEPSSSEDFSEDGDVAENRRFWLRQGGGRLIDGWGSALLFYMDDDDLYVVSAGSDRRINYGDYYLNDTEPYDNGPADTSLSGNEDNIVMVLTKEQWDLTNQKTTTTRLMLQDLKKGIIGDRGNVTGGVKQPNGFVADIGGLETLVGSYVYDGTASTPIQYVYKCLKRGTTETPSSTASDWFEYRISDLDTSTYNASLEADYPFATMWQSSGRTYYEAQPHLLLMNADYVKVQTGGTSTDPEYTYYRYVNSETSTTTSFTASEWAEDDTFAGQEWVKEHNPSTTDPTTYTTEILPTWTYYSTVEFGAGWRGPYTSYTSGPLTDAWGREIILEMDKGSLVLRSHGPQVYVDETATPLVYYEDDDITETIVQSDYSVPATVTVKPEEISSTYVVEMATNDYVSVYSAFNGGVGYFNALIDEAPTSGSGLSGTFYFTRADGHKYGPTDVTTDAGSTLAITAGVGASEQAGTGVANEYKKGVWLPIGKVMVVYRSANYRTTGTTGDDGKYASPHPDTTLVDHTTSTTANTTSYNYQRTFLIHSKTNPELVLGEE